MNSADDSTDGAVIRLSSDEAVVLFELLSRWTDGPQETTPGANCFESTSECAVLHSLLADLEKQLSSPFRPEYTQLLERARGRLAHRWKNLNLL